MGEISICGSPRSRLCPCNLSTPLVAPRAASHRRSNRAAHPNRAASILPVLTPDPVVSTLIFGNLSRFLIYCLQKAIKTLEEIFLAWFGIKIQPREFLFCNSRFGTLVTRQSTKSDPHFSCYLDTQDDSRNKQHPQHSSNQAQRQTFNRLHQHEHPHQQHHRALQRQTSIGLRHLVP